jgi:hypothetical protein
MSCLQGVPFQAQYHGLIVPALMAAVLDVSPHVQERSCQALVRTYTLLALSLHVRPGYCSVCMLSTDRVSYVMHGLRR